MAAFATTILACGNSAWNSRHAREMIRVAMADEDVLQRQVFCLDEISEFAGLTGLALHVHDDQRAVHSKK